MYHNIAAKDPYNMFNLPLGVRAIGWVILLIIIIAVVNRIRK